MKPIVVVLGTRPEIIKLSRLIRELDNEVLLVHSHQHSDPEMSGEFFIELGLPTPHLTLTGISGVSRADQVGRMLQQLGRFFTAADPGAALVQGDTNTAAAGALAANFAGIPLLHVEAGLRSNDRLMPEEINRKLVGVLADVHCAATELNRDLLLAEGIAPETVHITGNTIVEATLETLRSLPAEPPTVIDGQGSDFVLVTIHRPENTDDPAALRRILLALAKQPKPAVFVAHPRTRAAIDRFGLAEEAAGITFTTPVNHRAFLNLASRARLLVSDSGGVQEEATILKKPLLVVRRSTERPEAVHAGFARLIQPADDLAEAVRAGIDDSAWRGRLLSVPSPFGDGTASIQIAELARSAARRRSPSRKFGPGSHTNGENTTR